MCSVTLAVTALSTGFSAYQQVQQGKAQQAQYEYQAAVDRNNQQIAQWQAQDALDRGAEEERRRRVQTNQQIGTQRTQFASSGIDLGSENVIDTLSDTAMIGELDALTIRSNAEREAFGHEVQAQNFENSATANTTAGENARTTGTLNATSTILGGASTVSNQYDKWKQTKPADTYTSTKTGETVFWNQ